MCYSAIKSISKYGDTGSKEIYSISHSFLASTDNIFSFPCPSQFPIVEHKERVSHLSFLLGPSVKVAAKRIDARCTTITIT